MVETDQLIEDIARDSTPVRPAPHPFVLTAWWFAGAAVYLALALEYFGLRPDLMSRIQLPLFLAEVSLLAAIVATTSLSAALLAFPDMHQKRPLAILPVVAGVLFVLVLGLAWHADDPASPRPLHSLQCTTEITMVSLLPAALMFFSMRNFASIHPYAAGSTMLLFAFGIGALSLRLAEQTDSIVHVVQWHYLPMAAAGIVGLWLGRIFLKW